MSTLTIAIDPVTRIEGHLKVAVQVEGGYVTDAWLTGGMYRGFEPILIGRDPRDAPQIVQRICGVCPVAHATAASMALEDACGLELTPNGRLARNIMLASNYIQSSILHCYHLAGQDYFQGPDTVPFIPRYAHPDLRLPPAMNRLALDEYLEALEIRQICHELVALFGGRMPHLLGIMGGGATEIPTKTLLVEYGARLRKVRQFVEQRYLPQVYRLALYYRDLLQVGHGYRNALCMGGFPLGEGKQAYQAGVYIDGKDQPFSMDAVREEARYAWFASQDSEAIQESASVPQLGKPDAYSFIKAPTYAGQRMEVGPLARLWINDLPLSAVGRAALQKDFGVRAETIRDMGEERAFSVMGRNLARAEEVLHLVGLLEGWLKAIEVGAPTFVSPVIPEEGEGIGVTEAPRGSLVHYLRINKGVLSAYSVIAASMWNCSPRDDQRQRGALEEALIGIPVPDTGSPVNVGRTIRAFDP